MGASAEIIYSSSITRVTYSDLFIALHDLLYSSKGKLLIFEHLQIV